MINFNEFNCVSKFFSKVMLSNGQKLQSAIFSFPKLIIPFMQIFIVKRKPYLYFKLK